MPTNIVSKKAFNNKIENSILENFRKSCKNIGIEQSKILEILMQGFSENCIEFEFKNGKLALKHNTT